MMKLICCIFILVIVLQQTSCKLVLNYWPKASQLYTVLQTGKTLLTCEVESDIPAQLKWYKDGKEITTSSKPPPWPFPHADKNGLTLIQFPYIFRKSIGEYECRASNGVDPPVSHKVRFTPLPVEKLPVGFPNVTKSPTDAHYNLIQYIGANLTFHCDATGEDTEVKWLFRKVPINKVSKSVPVGNQAKLEYKLSNNGRVLNIINLGKVTLSWLECFVANSVGMNMAGKVQLSSKPGVEPTIPPKAPVMTKKPSNVSVGGPEQWVTFECAASGYPKPLYHWRHDGEIIRAGHPHGKVSVVAMRSGNLTCIAYNDVGEVSATAFLGVKPLPYQPKGIEIKDNSQSHFTVILRPSFREAQWHKNIPITHAILQHKPFQASDSHKSIKSIKITVMGSAPWYYRFANLDPWTYINVRVAFVNKYGTGNFSEWYRGHSEWGELNDPVRNLTNQATSNQSFTLTWKKPIKTNGPLKRFEVYFTLRSDAKLKDWFKFPVERSNQKFSYDWHKDNKITAIAPVIYWKVRAVGFLNSGPFSETKVFRVYPGAPGSVTALKAETLDSRSIQVTWNQTKETGNGIIGYKILYNRQDKPAVERKWKVMETSDPKTVKVILKDLSPNRPYEIKIYPRSKAWIGVPSQTAFARTKPDAPTAPPQNVRGKPKHSQTIEVTWNPPPEDHQNSPILSYKVFYTQKMERKPYSKELNKDAREVQLQGLGKYKKYKIWIVAYNEKGESPPSHIIEVFTYEQVPEGAPLAVQAQAFNDSTIAVTWLPPSSLLQNGRIIGYKVYYSEWPNCRNDYVERLEELQVNGANERDALISRFINPNRHYKILVAALTSVGAGVKSLPLCIQTPKKRPTAPNVKLTLDKTANDVSLKWWPPPSTIKAYKIEFGKTLRKFDMLTDIKTKDVGSDILQSLFDDLDSGVYYCFKLYGLLDQDKGWTAANTKWVKTTDGIPSGPPLYFEGHTESSSSIKLKWEEPDPWLRNGRIVGYDILYSRTGDVQRKAEYTLKGDEDAIVFPLTGLKANSEYSIKVRARTMVGAGTKTEPLVVKTGKEVLPVVSKLGVMEVSASTAYIHWSTPLNARKFRDFNFEYIVNYACNKTYRSEDGKFHSKITNESVTIITKMYELDNLLPGTDYVVTVRVDLNDAGIGDPQQISFTTKNEKPKIVVSAKYNPKIEMTNNIPLMIPAVSEMFGPIHHCCLFVVNLRDQDKLPASLNTSQFYDPDASDITQFGKRRRREVNNVGTANLPDYHIASWFYNSELPTLFKLGNGSKREPNTNRHLEVGHHYTTFVRAYVETDLRYEFTHSDSPFSKPVKYTPTQHTKDLQTGSDGDKGAGKSGNSTMFILGGVAGVVVIALVVVILIFLLKRRRNGDGESDRLLERKRKGSTDPTDIHRLQSNTVGMIQHPPLPVERLADHVALLRANNGARNVREYKSIDSGDKPPPSEASLLPQNKMKNRYPNVLAFDHSRVKLDHTGVLCSDYINANYIDGYCKEKAYISTQGPLKATVEDFWRMCWEQNVQSIVMMTKLEERKRIKCEQYWPSSGLEIYGEVKVLLKDTRSYAYYCVRTFEITSTVCNDTRILKQFQFLQWPDPGVPTQFGPILSFVRRVRDFDPPACGPTVVHCSAGVSRSACYIAIDSMLERLKHDSMIDIYAYVTMMRTQRNFMVQTDLQYMFIYDVLVEAIEYGNTEIASSDLATIYKGLTELRPDGGEPLLEVQFKSLALASEDEGLSIIPHNDINEMKNRCRTIVPYNQNRVMLQQIRNQEGSDYINASYIDGFYKKNAYIATQGPFQDTVADFWRMVMEQESSIIVMVTGLEERGKDQCFQYWPSTRTLHHYYYVIDPQQEKKFANFIVREFVITDARDSTTRTVRQYQYLNWPSANVPLSSDGIIELIGLVQKAQTKSETKGPIIVHGSTGAGRTGVFVALSIALESLRSERIVDVYQIVKALRHQRPYMVQTIEQYEYCYRVACDFLKNFDFIV